MSIKSPTETAIKSVHIYRLTEGKRLKMRAILIFAVTVAAVILSVQGEGGQWGKREHFRDTLLSTGSVKKAFAILGKVTEDRYYPGKDVSKL